ncbi:repressor of RNA polymerase III transcription MAF1 homolog [Papaver somniferum]|uniref:repressor of RNA polymerase III transcription MAF1 homolog n=1 Tax=Papaver somniferum TaxID=3469 RepID=UPI000E6F8D69|nr:repressor of RNA polymerase III transcription MAF1 homolog [Papaver somniferum]
MKYLEFTNLDRINQFLNYVSFGEYCIKGSLEAYSCKHTGTDKKLSFSLDQEILDYLGQSADSDPPSPASILSSRSSRKTLIYLVLTLGHMYPDYDFSAVQAHRFFREEDWTSVKQTYDTYMFEVAKEWAAASGGSDLLESLYKSLDEVVKLGECEIYCYSPEPDSDGDPFLERGAIWSFNFFFYNRKIKRVISFRCCCLSNLAAEGFLMDESRDDEDGYIFSNMDM